MKRGMAAGDLYSDVIPTPLSWSSPDPGGWPYQKCGGRVQSGAGRRCDGRGGSRGPSHRISEEKSPWAASARVLHKDRPTLSWKSAL